MAQQCSTVTVLDGEARDYLPIENYGMIGNMRTCALVSMDGSIDFMCWPYFDSPSIFCRLLDKHKGGFFSLSPSPSLTCNTKQQYLPSSAILQTRYIHEDGVVDVVDFFPRPKNTTILSSGTTSHYAYREAQNVPGELKKWLVRRVECIRGSMSLEIEIFPAFDYAREGHKTTILAPERRADDGISKTVTFHGKTERLQLDVVICGAKTPSSSSPVISFKKELRKGMTGEGVHATVDLQEGEHVSFILREDLEQHVAAVITPEIVDSEQHSTQAFWFKWLSKSKYRGGWREVVSRSLLILKMLTFEPTGAIVAAPTFSIPEAIGGPRNWDYRFSWVRDSSFTIYILLRMGFSDEADAYMAFIDERLRKTVTANSALPIMFTIHGETDIPELELDHLEGYKGSKPVRIGNGAAFHQQFDVYGELMDGIYLYNKYGKPVSWDTWTLVRKMLDYVLTIVNAEPDMSIWEVRNHKQNFVYSKVMLWVAFDRGLRLADKRCLPCPNRARWTEARDTLYEEVMEKGKRYNQELGCFVQSYENNTMLDSSILIAPLVFFIAPNDPRFTKTVDRILLPVDKGGLTSAGLVYRYDTAASDDVGVGGVEGAFSMCTFWLVEALTRASSYDSKYFVKAVNLFENMLSFSNHLYMFSEEIARSGQQLGNTPQAFSHLALVSAAFNLSRVTDGSKNSMK
ncbi:glycosyl hydrolase [Microdochium trichocladiopsis]|uniref:Glycosyl hydrolase n=1 Tax=Microdochium trichocladiopsis TaxID=1682393 RepID=A0A9P9BQP4_9PEZI|nr:glycosyl hydrolase [Microdochium trichocladiopsis]KAH7035098.1 glycosyl hydrolase [Microdochium trichocladiopsis]